MSAQAVAAWSLPWIVVPVAILWKARKSSLLESFSAEAPPHAPLVSVIVPARDEARNIDACVRSILASTWPNLEVIVVNDHSTDGTGEIARRIADPRLHVIDNPDLPDGWFGKQWACQNGAAVASGSFMLFTDADTRHGAELLARSMHAMRERRADLFSVAGSQTMDTFWEKLLQPHVFGLMLARFGDLDRVSASKNPYDKVANGQMMLLRRDVYDRAGGHEAVRSHVAEDLRMAQEWTRLGYSVQLISGLDFMSTRMYVGLGEFVKGWGKNIYAAGRDTLDLGPVGRALLRLVFPMPSLWEIVPLVMVVLALLGIVSPAFGVWGAIAYTCSTIFWIVLHWYFRSPIWYAFLNPLASVIMFGTFARAAWKGDRVEWKGRAYVSK